MTEQQSRSEPTAKMGLSEKMSEKNGTGASICSHDEEDDIPPVFRDTDLTLSDEDLSSEDQLVRQEGTLALEGLIELTTDNDGWNLKTVDDIKCYTKYINGRKVVKMESIVTVSAQRLWAILYPGENTPEWNNQCEVNKSLHQVDRMTDVVYTISKAVGPLSARDFVSARKIALRNGAYYLCCKSIVTDLMPEQSGNVRGENGPCGYKVIPIDSSSCHFVWVYNSVVKGWLPQVVVDQAASSALIAAFQQLLKYVKT